jgi:hypothetical protein
MKDHPFRVYKKGEYVGEERRRKTRIYYPIPIKIRFPEKGELTELGAVAEDLSAGGFSAHTRHECKIGQKLFLIIRFSLAGKPHGATTVAAHGTVLRSRQRFDGSYLIAVSLDHYRFI